MSNHFYGLSPLKYSIWTSGELLVFHAFHFSIYKLNGIFSSAKFRWINHFEVIPSQPFTVPRKKDNREYYTSLQPSVAQMTENVDKTFLFITNLLVDNCSFQMNCALCAKSINRQFTNKHSNLTFLLSSLFHKIIPRISTIRK